ncbi:GntR family transcriptional regulator [Brenneria goodwinii]|uniref:GntR family transcriptional regulator n=1 Tax=Brenneria goodwinii TaxID=1109412 RepID=A0AAE8JPA2_9GAMM|nr:GntR family transcriptional regulator [Brenneria goodwinii]ATA25325.1 GntR family transcriptional regulator [Brenneria goodwinii]RLM28627.1 GntR family transcriptional regulator [Brenneria goodwinii]
MEHKEIPEEVDVDAGENNATKGLGNQVYDELVALILSRKLRQGEQIQERALALRLNVSRTPLREAMHRLEGERVLERNSSNRLFVRLVSIQEIMEILHVRRMLEADAATRATGHIPQTRLLALRERIEALTAAADPTPADFYEVDTSLHELILEYCENTLLASIIADLRLKTRMFSPKHLEKARGPAVCEEHLAIVDALIRSDSAAAAAETIRHINNIRQSIIDKLSAV